MGEWTGWVDGWMDGETIGWTGGWPDGWVGRSFDGSMVNGAWWWMGREGGDG